MTQRSPARKGGSRKDFLYALLASVFEVPAQAAPTNPKKLLVVQLQQVGDTVIFSPALRALRHRFPESRIDVLANPTSAQLYRASPRVDRIIVADGWNATSATTRLRLVIPLIRTLRRERYDCVVTDITGQSFAYALLAFLTGAPFRVGFDLVHRGFLHNVRVPCDPALPYVLCNLALARALGASNLDAREEIMVADADRAAARAKLAAAGIDDTTSIAVLHPGSNWQSKTWYADRWAEIADTLVHRHGHRVVFVGTRSEAALIEATRAAMRQQSTSVAGATTLGELAALIGRADVFVGTDSGPRNIAGALGVPNVTVMSAQEDTGHWRGVRLGEYVVRSDARCTGCYFARCAHRLCMAAIDAESVATLVELALRHGRTAAPRLRTVPVPEPLYVAVSGRRDPDRRTLQTLAKRLPEVAEPRVAMAIGSGPPLAKV